MSKAKLNEFCERLGTKKKKKMCTGQGKIKQSRDFI